MINVDWLRLLSHRDLQKLISGTDTEVNIDIPQLTALDNQVKLEQSHGVRKVRKEQLEEARDANHRLGLVQQDREHQNEKRLTIEEHETLNKEELTRIPSTVVFFSIESSFQVKIKTKNFLKLKNAKIYQYDKIINII